MNKKTVSLFLASSIVLSTFSPVIASEKLIDLQGAKLTQQVEALAEGNNCPSKDETILNFQNTVDSMFNSIGEKEGIYKAKYYPEHKIVEVFIIDKTKSAKELTGTGIVAGLYNFYKNHNLVKVKIGNQDERDLKLIAQNSQSEAEVMQNFKTIFGSDILTAVQTYGSKTGKLEDFINKEVQIKLTVDVPNCNDNLTLTYTIRGKESISSVMKDKIKSKDLNVWKGSTDINWRDGVEIISQPGNQQGLINYLEEAKVEDASNRNFQNSGTQNGNLKLTFTDGTSLLLNDQNLNVSEHILPITDTKAPKDAIDVTFRLGEGVEAGDPTITGNKENPVEFSSYKIKPDVDVSKEKIQLINSTIFELIRLRALKGYENPTWKPLRANPNDFIVSENNNVFVASATEAVSSMPEVNVPIDGAKSINGTGVIGATISVTVPGIAKSIETKVDVSSKWEIKLPAGKVLKTGDKLVITQKEEDRKVSPAKEVVVKEKDKPTPKPNPNPNPTPDNKMDNYYNGFNYVFPYNLSMNNNNNNSKTSSNNSLISYSFSINKDEYEITTNGVTNKSKMYTSPIIRNGRTLLPIRNVAEAIGAEIAWNEKTKTASFTKDGLTASIQIDSDEIIYSNGKKLKMDSKPIIKDNRILVSIVNVANIFGLTNGNIEDSKDQDIEWNKDTNTVTIKLKK